MKKFDERTKIFALIITRVRDWCKSMSDYLTESVIAKIEAQQPKERTAVWMVGEQLKDILRENPQFSEVVLQDLDVKEMSLAECEKKIKAYADKHKTGNFACVTPAEAEEIIREFYGMSSQKAETASKRGTKSGTVIDLSNFF